MKDYSKKSSVEEIKSRFDKDVERFSNLDTGQISTIDATISLEILTESAKRINPNAETMLDIGCGAGNYTLKMLSKIPTLKCTLVDLSKPMLDKAVERIRPYTANEVITLQSDLRDATFENNSFDIILAGAVLHHLRGDNDWENVFKKLYSILKPGGCLLISDMVIQSNEQITAYVWEMYAQYLEELNGKEYREKLLEYIEKEDSPRSVIYQLELMENAGFKSVDILHKNLNFATYMGIK